MTSDHQKLGGLFRFAAGILEATKRIHFTMAEHRLGVFREHELKDLPGLHLNPGNDEWLSVERLREEKPPLPDKVYEDWLASELGNPEARPRLHEVVSVRVTNDEASDLIEGELVDPDEVGAVRLRTTSGGRDVLDDEHSQVVLRLERLQQFTTTFERWAESTWQPWAARELPRRKTIRLYKQLYELHNRIHAGIGNTIPELVWGIGLHRWKPPAHTEIIDLPVIEYPVDLVLEEGGTLSVRPRRVGPTLSLQAFMETGLRQAEIAQGPLSDRLEQRLADPDLVFTPFAPETYEDILQACADRLSARARFVSELEIRDGQLIEPAGPDLVVYSTWTLFGRPRSEDARGADLKKLCAKIEGEDGKGGAGKELPRTLRGLVATPENQPADEGDEWDLRNGLLGTGGSAGPSGAAIGTGDWIRNGGSGGSAEPPEEPKKPDYFFPLPYNDEQARIIDCLDKHDVAVVTGPPGTGKTHTIANIISHYMATGRRVLVTARTPEAIGAMQDKLPEELRRLTIAAIYSDREGNKQLEAAVTALADEASLVNAKQKRNEIRTLEQQVIELDREIASLERRLSQIAHLNLQAVTYDDSKLLPMVLAERLRGEREVYGWFADRPAPGSFSGVDDQLIRQIAHLRDELGEDLVYLDETLPAASELPDTGSIVAAHEVLREQEGKPAEDLSDAPIMTRDTQDAEDRARMLREDFAVLSERLETLGDGWLRSWYEACLRDRLDKPIARPADEAKALLGRLEEVAALLARAEVESLELPSLLSEPDAFERTVQALARGEKALGLRASLFKRSLVREIEQVRIGGRKPEGRDDWEAVIRQRTLHGLIREFVSGWKTPTGFPDLPGIPDNPAEAAEAIGDLAREVRETREVAADVPDLLDQLKAIFSYGLDAENNLLQGRCESILLAFRANLDTAAKGPPAAVTQLLWAAESGRAPLFEQIRMLAEQVGGKELDTARLVEARGALTQEITRLVGLQPKLSEFKQLVARVAGAGAPDWARMISDPEAETASVLPEGWRKAWAWGEAMTNIEKLNDLENSAELRAGRSDRLRRRAALFKQVIRERTLLGLHGKLTDRIRQALTQFTTAIQRLGKGTGQQAGRWRKAIQDSALAAAPAAPVWVMPEYRVCEQLPAEIGDFDLVVLDEASQSDVTAISALARGKRMLIVGDDQQVSPTSIGVPVARVDALRAEHLRDLAHRDQIDPETSIFDLAQQMFPQARLMLREHFRCVEPIIQFSAQFYNNRLIPLRIPKASERLDPPLIDIYVPHGERRGTLNPDEAHAIVAEIASLTSNPAFAERSIGVISLVGADQAQHIHRRLIEHPLVGHEGIDRHQIVCGDSRTLQGQERDIIFLSMVVSAGQASSQTTRSTAQRLNVAMSRARDRLYLLRSVDLHHLKPVDYKHRVVEHFRNPMPEGRKASGQGVLDRCQSDFERNVCELLLDAGYRVRSQVKVGAYSIDLVVDGPEDRRLAVELDGDKYHGPERWAEDMARQAALERAGWTFWRVFGSQWNGDPDYWWGDLTATLDRLGISPLGAEECPEVFVELRRIERPQEETPGKAETQREAAQTGATTTAASEVTHAPGDAAESERLSADDVALKEQAGRPASTSEEGLPDKARPREDGAPLDAIYRARQPDSVGLEKARRRPDGQLDIEDFEPPSDAKENFGLEESTIASGSSPSVCAGCRVTIRWADSGKTQTVTISDRDDKPDQGIIHVEKPLAQALLEAEVEEEVEFRNEAGKSRLLTVEAVFEELEAND
ncbi:AAA domain-containing protein [Algihabitans albus]|uniref:AAA domain-containing protein n=1 Tax=Algihabitans albus TaxID=2164067 RepID=UPI0035CEDFEC